MKELVLLSVVIEQVVLRGVTNTSEDASEYVFEVSTVQTHLQAPACWVNSLSLFLALPGELVRWFRDIRCPNSAGGDGAAVPGEEHWEHRFQSCAHCTN